VAGVQQTKSEIKRRMIASFRIVSIPLFVIVFVLVFMSIGFAGILQVPNEYLSIQEAIDACEPGDTVVVASGLHKLYYGNLKIAKKSLTLKGSYGAGKTIIQGRGNSPVITILENSRVVIDGFTIRSIHDEDAVVSKGGGIFCAPSSSPTVVNNVINGNRAVFGGGIYCAPSSSPTIKNNVISENKAGNFGGGIFSYKASPNITNNTIAENEASSAGGGIYCDRDTLRITNNIIWNNKAKSGGGISCDRSFCEIINNTITKNEAVYGGGIYFYKGAVRIINTILWQNTDDLYSPVFGPSSRPNHSNLGDGDFRGLNGNISADPLFSDPENGDFRLRPDSPCLDAGDPDPGYFDPDGSRNDMGTFGGPNASAHDKLE
jgi:parallel beta-helix repeat protein